jgi:hypothetical protein
MVFHSQGSGLHVITAVIGVLYVGGGADERWCQFRASANRDVSYYSTLSSLFKAPACRMNDHRNSLANRVGANTQIFGEMPCIAIMASCRS